jgi:hypothetical protein
MGLRQWLELRAVELLASVVAVGLLIGGLAAGLPFLRARVPEVFLYSVCCISAVFIHAGLDLGGRGLRRLASRVASRPALPIAFESAAA